MADTISKSKNTGLATLVELRTRRGSWAYVIWLLAYLLIAMMFIEEMSFHRGAKTAQMWPLIIPIVIFIVQILAEMGWQLEAWAVFSNHYHFVAHSPPIGGKSLTEALRQLRLKTATWVNRLEGKPKRKVWHNFWETRLTYQPSYLARLKYVHHNAVRHGLVNVPREYPWCSASWFERTVTAAEARTIYGFKIDAVSVMDDYAPLADW